VCTQGRTEGHIISRCLAQRALIIKSRQKKKNDKKKEEEMLSIRFRVEGLFLLLLFKMPHP
jgi:hypothetical protein